MPELSAKDGSGRPVVFSGLDDMEAPAWAGDLLAALNANADALSDVAASIRQLGRPTKDILVHTRDPVEDTFPMFVKFDQPPKGLVVIWPQNLTTPTALFYEPVAIDFVRRAGGINIRYISGLDVSSRYKITVEVINET